MTSDNAFSFNLSYLKSQAKHRLKAIRRGDHHALQSVQQFHPKQAQLNPDNIKLADIQFVMAREYGLPSWSRLKHHAEMLEHHKQQIDQGSEALDKDLATLHIRCGHDIAQRLEQAGFHGDFLPFIDPYCMGPLSAAPDFEWQRADYIRQYLLSEIGDPRTTHDILTDTADKLVQLANPDYRRLVFWVEHDNYDQLMLMRLLAYVSSLQDVADRQLEIIEVNHFPGNTRFIGLGQLPAEGLRSLWQHRRTVDAVTLKRASELWQGFCAPDPAALLALLDASWLSQFENMAQVIHRHLQELPHQQSGLSLTQSLALTVLSTSGKMTVANLFRDYQALEPLPFLGDLMFWVLLKPLLQGCQPLIGLDPSTGATSWLEQTVSITELGRLCLTQQQKMVSGTYWVGGIKVSPEQHWAWDHASLSSLHWVQD
ncbi:DUF1835 domain-containing protein [Photobacterium halotolerans]|uniref:DUF1835 domain-containing protein n=1 Tax=Photobacterium halotolerans TaxID=265726 RepID=A0A0F5V892_9GAMM|nr:DUF1835 domain-containing protein [Photobacterium halotolerans]KKC98400.1 hypothetical protein KY46_18395 [Photobacterium halotolerans]